MVKKQRKGNEDKSPYVAIPSSLAGIFLVIVIMFLIFDNSQLDLLVHLIWGFVVLGVVALWFLHRSDTLRKRK